MNELQVYMSATIFLTLLSVFLIMRISLINNYNKTMLTRIERWESAYWNLLGSDAVDKDNYEIHLPWLTYGDVWLIKKN